MCKSITIRFSCGHTRNVCLSRCRHTHTHLVCKGAAKKEDLPALRMQTLCIHCYAAWQTESTALVPKAGEVELIWRPYKRTSIKSLKETKSMDELERLMKKMKVGREKSDGVVARRNVSGDLGKGMSKVEILAKRKEHKWARKGKSGIEKVKGGKKVSGGSPLRFEVTVEDLEAFEQEKEKKAKESKDKIMSWAATKAKLSTLRGEAVTLSRLMQAEVGQSRVAWEGESSNGRRDPAQHGFGGWSVPVASCFCELD